MPHEPMPLPEAVVFDLDGTLIDSVPVIARTINGLLADLGRAPLDLGVVQGMVGDGAPALVLKALRATGGVPADDGQAAIYEEYAIRLAMADPDRDCIYPDVESVLARLAGQGTRLAICSNKPEAATRNNLSALGLAAWFDAVVGGDSLPQRKPDGEPVLHALAQMGVGAGAAIMVGDSRNDVLAAHAAGLQCIAVTYGYANRPLDELGADLLIDRFADLPRAIETLFSPADRQHTRA